MAKPHLFDFITARVATGQMLEDKKDVDKVVDAGITHVIDLRANDKDAEDEDRLLLANHPVIHFLWNPAKDDGKPKPAEWFAQSIEFALDALSRPETKVLAHCHGGKNRGPSTALAILVALGLDPSYVEGTMRTVRPVVELAYKADAIAAVHELGYC